MISQEMTDISTKLIELLKEHGNVESLTPIHFHESFNLRELIETIWHLFRVIDEDMKTAYPQNQNSIKFLVENNVKHDITTETAIKLYPSYEINSDMFKRHVFCGKKYVAINIISDDEYACLFKIDDKFMFNFAKLKKSKPKIKDMYKEEYKKSLGEDDLIFLVKHFYETDDIE